MNMLFSERENDKETLKKPYKFSYSAE